jgi:hypothetical protein
MLDWKINQKIFEALGTKNDILGVHIPLDRIKVVDGNQIHYVNIQFYDLEYVYLPAKSYCVALVYAAELTKDFGGTMIDYLSDKELLLNDIYFVPYTEDSSTYDYFIYRDEWQTSPMAAKIKDYYKKEIYLEDINNGY